MNPEVRQGLVRRQRRVQTAVRRTEMELLEQPEQDNLGTRALERIHQFVEATMAAAERGSMAAAHQLDLNRPTIERPVAAVVIAETPKAREAELPLLQHTDDGTAPSHSCKALAAG